MRKKIVQRLKSQKSGRFSVTSGSPANIPLSKLNSRQSDTWTAASPATATNRSRYQKLKTDVPFSTIPGSVPNRKSFRTAALPSPMEKLQRTTKSYIGTNLVREKELDMYQEPAKKKSGGGIIFLDRDEYAKKTPATNKSVKFERTPHTNVSFGNQKQTPKFSKFSSPYNQSEIEPKFKDIAPSMIKREMRKQKLKEVKAGLRYANFGRQVTMKNVLDPAKRRSSTLVSTNIKGMSTMRNFGNNAQKSAFHRQENLAFMASIDDVDSDNS